MHLHTCTHLFDDDDCQTFSLTLFYEIYKTILISLIYQAVSMIKSLGKETSDFYELVSCRIHSFTNIFKNRSNVFVGQEVQESTFIM